MAFLTEPSVEDRRLRGDAVERAKFIEKFDKFCGLIEQYEGAPFRSFREGAPEDWEGYKPLVRAEALRRLEPDSWTAEDVGTGRIISAMVHSIEIKLEKRNETNNLVNWYDPRRNQDYEALRATANAPGPRQAIESAAFSLFHEEGAEGSAFESMAQVIGRRSRLISYFMFLLDDDRFMPLAPVTFKSAFQELDLDVRSTQGCRWEGYQAYCLELEKVRHALEDWANLGPTRLVDAHSFCWMLARLPGKIEERAQREAKRDLRQTKTGGAASEQRRLDDLTFGIEAAFQDALQRVQSTVRSANGQLVQRRTKNKEFHGFESDNAFRDRLRELWEEQGGRCRLTGIQMLPRKPPGGHGFLCMSVDRIDSDGHYEPENIQLVCRFANMWKGTMADAVFLQLLRQVRDVDEVCLPEDYPGDEP
jgi:hypothetical protein